MNPDPKIFVVIPAFRAEATLPEVLQRIPRRVSGIIVVDDCSPDSTAQVVEEWRHVDPRITLVRHTENHGVGGAMQSGYRAALEMGAEIMVKMDSDGQMDPAYLDKLVAPLLAGDADYTKGNRFLHEKALTKMPYLRRIGNLGLSFLTKAASGYWNIFDPTNGYTAITAEAARELNFDRLAKRYFFETSMLLELGLLRLVVKDVYIPAVYGNEISSLSISRSLFEFPPRLLRGMLRRISYFYFIRDFSAVTVFLLAGWGGILFGTTWGGYHWWRSSQLEMAASTGTVMIAILPLIIGLQLLLQAVVMDIQNTPEKRR